MRSIKSLYKIGYGPSSSHTMGPAKACEFILKNYDFEEIDVILYNSLALTGIGHLTDVTIKKVLKNKKLNLSTAIDKEKHPNYLYFRLYKNNKILKELGCKSIGGGDIIFDNEKIKDEPDIYPHKTFNDIKKYCKENNLSLYDYVKKFEGEDIDIFLEKIYDTMVESIKRGISTEGILPGPLKVKRKAKTLYEKPFSTHEPSEITESRLVSAYAFAVNEENAAGGIIVTSPTCGASGVLPSVLYYMNNKYNFITKKRVIKALAVAGIIGNLIRTNASISGAVCGCQAEIGSATSMAAAAHAQLFNLSLDKIEYAAEIAMEHSLGLTCDPINGYVQIPCIERNAVAALRAIDSCGLSFLLSDSRKVSLDTVIDTMYHTGLDMNNKYKETSEGGLAIFYKETNCW